MKLYLSSIHMGDQFGVLVDYLGSGAKVAVISNAVDYIPPETRLAYLRTVFDPVAHFNDRDLAATDLDLRTFFGRAAALEEALAEVRLVWAVGGNAFLLRRAMRQSGFDEIVRQRVKGDDLIYAGWSAGSVVAGPSLCGIELMDDPALLAEGYDPAPIWEGLDLIDFTIVPHFRSNHPEAPAAERAAAWLESRGLPFRPLRDGEVVIV